MIEDICVCTVVKMVVFWFYGLISVTYLVKLQIGRHVGRVHRLSTCFYMFYWSCFGLYSLVGVWLYREILACLRPALSSLLGLTCLWLHLASGLGGVTERKQRLFGHRSVLVKNYSCALALNHSLP